MIIIDASLREKRPTLDEMKPRPGDTLDMAKLNSLPSPITARLCGGSEWWIETLDVQTGCMRLDVCGQIDLSHFSEVIVLIDFDGNEHEPDDFWLD